MTHYYLIQHNFNAWIKLSDSFKLKKEVNNVLHVGNFPVIKKDKIKKEFILILKK